MKATEKKATDILSKEDIKFIKRFNKTKKQWASTYAIAKEKYTENFVMANDCKRRFFECKSAKKRTEIEDDWKMYVRQANEYLAIMQLADKSTRILFI